MQEMQEMWVWSLGWNDPLEEKIVTHSKSLLGYSPVGHKERLIH